MRLRALGVTMAIAVLAHGAEARTWRIAPTPDGQQRLQTALIEAQPGDTIRLAAGRFELTQGLSLAVDNVIVRGAGHQRTILSFFTQSQGAEGLLVTGDNVTLEDFAVEDARGDAIKALDCNTITFRGLRAEWMRGPNPNNGAYGFYPVNCDNVLIEKSIARAASDAGIYVGQSRNIIVRDNLAERNVAGIEIENSNNADVYGNTAHENTGGILIFDLPGLAQMGGHSTRVYKNRIVANNTPNFAPPGNTVAGVPSGTGLMVMANRDVHIFDNDFSENGAVNVLITAYRQKIDDPNYNPLPRDIVVRDNRMGRAGFNAGGSLGALAAAGVTLPDILWDGATIFSAAGAPHSERVQLVIRGNDGADGDSDPTYLSAGLSVAEMQPDTTIPALGDIPEPARVRLPQD